MCDVGYLKFTIQIPFAYSTIQLSILPRLSNSAAGLFSLFIHTYCLFVVEYLDEHLEERELPGQRLNVQRVRQSRGKLETYFTCLFEVKYHVTFEPLHQYPIADYIVSH